MQQYRKAIEDCYFLRAKGDNGSNKACIEAIKLLNHLTKTAGQTPLLTLLSRYCLSVYEHREMTIDDKILWLHSVYHNLFFPPELQFGDISSASDVFVYHEDQPELELPTGTYDNPTVVDWSADPTDMENLHQDMLSNCSFVSSFLCLVHSGMSDHLLGLISPHGPSTHYTIKLTFNGCTRLVTIDNKLPVVDNGRSLTIASYSNPQLLWPALIEKAYLKVMGNGYNNEGSNMAYDTYMITGWAPEIVSIKDGRLPKTVRQYLGPNVTLGLGTGKISPGLSEQIGLISHHDYTVLKVDLDSNEVVLKNPWLEDKDKRRVIVLPLNDLFQFRYFYVNYNTSKMFKYAASSTFIVNDQASFQGDYSGYPQYSISNPTHEQQEVWLFLERFNGEKDAAICLYVLKTDGDRVLFPHQYPHILSMEPTNSRTSLAKLVMDPSQSYTVVMHSSLRTSMRLMMYNNISPDFELTKARRKYREVTEAHDEWDFTNNGGQKLLSSFTKNPQFDLVITQPTDILLSLLGSLADHSVSCVVLFSEWSNKGKPLRQVSRVLVDEQFSYGASYQDMGHVSPGIYRIVCCNSNKVRGPFKLQIHHNVPNAVELTSVSGSVGLFMDSKRYDWSGTNRYKMKFTTAKHNSQFVFQIQHSNNDFASPSAYSDYRPQIRGSVFNADTQVPVTINEDWSTNLYGVFVDCTVGPGNYILLVERLEPGTGAIEITLGSNNQFNIR